MINQGRSPSSLLSKKCKYRTSDKIGSGAYGEVFKSFRVDDGVSVALKRVMITDEMGFNNIPLSTHRELNVLKKLNNLGNDNIVKLFDIVLNKVEGRMCIDIVFELSDCDLEKYLRRANKGGDMPLFKILNLGQQLMDGIQFMHLNRIIHRDLKPANILIDDNGTNLKITDFGLARILGFDAALTPVAVTLWYRSPEILFKNSYLTSCDVWSAGCIIGEMVFGRPLFAADDEFKQMEKIVCRLGREAIDNWPEDAFFNFNSFVECIDPCRSLDRILKRADAGLRSLIKELLRFDPDQRMISTDALNKLNELLKLSSDMATYGCTCHRSPLGKSCNLPECIFDSQNRILVNSVVRNVFDDDDFGDIPIPGMTDDTSIEDYPHEEVEVNGVFEDASLDNTDLDNSYGNDDSPKSLCNVKNDSMGARDSFGSYRNQDNESFSSYATSHTGVDSITDDDTNEHKELHELKEFHEGFVISDSDSDTCYQVEVESHSLDISGSTTTRDGEDTKDTIVSEDSQDCPLSTADGVNLSPFLIKTDMAQSDSPDSLFIDHTETIKSSVPLQELNNRYLIDLVSPADSKKAQSTRKRIISSDNSGDSESEVENVFKTKPTVARHKSLRRRLSIVGPHVASDRKTPCRRVSMLAAASIDEDVEIQNRSFGESSLSRALDSVADGVESPLTGRPRVIVRRRSQWK